MQLMQSLSEDVLDVSRRQDLSFLGAFGAPTFAAFAAGDIHPGVEEAGPGKRGSPKGLCRLSQPQVVERRTFLAGEVLRMPGLRGLLGC